MNRAERRQQSKLAIQRRFYRTTSKSAIRRVTEEVRKEIARENEIRELMGVAA